LTETRPSYFAVNIRKFSRKILLILLFLAENVLDENFLAENFSPIILLAENYFGQKLGGSNLVAITGKFKSL